MPKRFSLAVDGGYVGGRPSYGEVLMERDGEWRKIYTADYGVPLKDVVRRALNSQGIYRYKIIHRRCGGEGCDVVVETEGR